MSYLVLARKYRPQLFADLIGQEHVTRTLTNAIEGGRIHHACLFTGARGVGKTSAARIFAKSLNCESGPTATPCNQCVSCLEITAGTGVDVVEIDGASNNGVDDIRSLRENIRYLPASSRYKIFIIDEVHMLSINAFNALLKTLEEPPEHAKFIFATTEPHKIPVTILSRCQRFDFRKIAAPVVAEQLRKIVTAEDVEISDTSLIQIARNGGGSMRDALSTLDQVIAFCGMSIDDADVRQLLGMVDRSLLVDSARAILQRNSRQVLDIVAQVDHIGISFRQFVRELVDFFRAMVISKVIEDAAAYLDVSVDELKEIEELSLDSSLEELQRIVTLLSGMDTTLAHSSSPRLHVEMLLLRLASLLPVKDIARLVQSVERLQSRISGGASAVTAAPQTPYRSQAAPLEKTVRTSAPVTEKREAAVKVEAAEPDTSSGVDGEQKKWPDLVRFVKEKRPALGALLEHGSLLQLDLPLLKLGYVQQSFQYEQMRDNETLQRLQAIADEFFAQKIKIEVVAINKATEASTPNLVQERRMLESDRKKRLHDDALKHPVIQSAQEVFSGTIEEIRPIDKGFV